jgi:hypothetical protein
MFSTRQQSIPKVFLDKIEIDKKIQDVLKSKKVIGINELTPLLKQQRYLRDDCKRHVQKKDDFMPGASI